MVKTIPKNERKYPKVHNQHELKYPTLGSTK